MMQATERVSRVPMCEEAEAAAIAALPASALSMLAYQAVIDGDPDAAYVTGVAAAAYERERRGGERHA